MGGLAARIFVVNDQRELVDQTTGAGDMVSFPWASMHTELVLLAHQEARRSRLEPGATGDVAQEACRLMLVIGAARLPSILLGGQRGAWLRILVRNIVRHMVREDLHWRLANAPNGASRHRSVVAAIPGMPIHCPLSWAALPAQEWRVLNLLRLGLTVLHVADCEGLAQGEVRRRMRWAALRLGSSAARRAGHLGLLPGSLQLLHGVQRARLAKYLVRQGWSFPEIGLEFGTSAQGVRRNLENHADRLDSHAFVR